MARSLWFLCYGGSIRIDFKINFLDQFNKFTLLFRLWCCFPCDQHKAFPLLPLLLWMLFRPCGSSFFPSLQSLIKDGFQLELIWSLGLDASFADGTQPVPRSERHFLLKPLFSQVFVGIKEFQVFSININRWKVSNTQSSFASWCNFDNICSYSLGTTENCLGIGVSFHSSKQGTRTRKRYPLCKPKYILN